MLLQQKEYLVNEKKGPQICGEADKELIVLELSGGRICERLTRARARVWSAIHALCAAGP
jgi:hypothetical protein